MVFSHHGTFKATSVIFSQTKMLGSLEIILNKHTLFAINVINVSTAENVLKPNCDLIWQFICSIVIQDGWCMCLFFIAFITSKPYFNCQQLRPCWDCQLTFPHHSMMQSTSM